MATEVRIGGDNDLFKGEDKQLELNVVDADGAAVDITGWTIKFIVRRTDVTAVMIEKTAVITGVFAPTNNPQRAVVTLTDTDLSIASGIYKHSWKRTDDGAETVLARGPFHVEVTTQT